MLSDEVTKDISRETRLLAIPNSSANLSRGVNSGNCLSRNESIVVHPPPPLPPPPAPPSQQQLHHSSPAMTPSIISASAAIQTAPNNLGCGARARECAGCTKPITERFLLKALDLFWHEDCLKCGCCDCRLGEVGSTLYTKANLILCKRDYLRLFGTTGYCAACNKVIPAFEMVMRAKSNVYHLECFACQQCNHRFCVGDRFYLCDNKILCEYDYEERLVFANMAYNPSSLAHIRRQVSNLQKQLETYQYVSERHLCLISIIYESMYEIYDKLNNNFELLNIIQIGNCFISITSKIFFIFTTLTDLDNATIFDALAVPHLIILMCPVIVLSTTTQNNIEECKVSNKILQNFLTGANMDNPRISSHQIELAEIIIRQMQHQRIRYTSFSFFEIEMSLIFMVVGAVTTYLVILLQFNIGT